MFRPIFSFNFDYPDTLVLEPVGLTPHGSIFALLYRSKPPACFCRAAFVHFRRPPWRLFFAIAQRSLGRRVYDSHTRSKPPACFWCAAFVRFRRHPWRLFLAIARHSLREASLRLASPLLRCQNTHVAQLRLSFCRLALGKNHQKSPRSLKVRQTP